MKKKSSRVHCVFLNMSWTPPQLNINYIQEGLAVTRGRKRVKVLAHAFFYHLTHTHTVAPNLLTTEHWSGSCLPLIFSGNRAS